MYYSWEQTGVKLTDGLQDNWSTVQKNTSSNNGVQGQMVSYNYNISKCIASTQKVIVLEDYSKPISRHLCKIRYPKSTSIEERVQELSDILKTPLTYKISEGCQLHGNSNVLIYNNNNELIGNIPFNY